MFVGWGKRSLITVKHELMSKSLIFSIHLGSLKGVTL